MLHCIVERSSYGARYVGLAKIHTQHVIEAIAYNLYPAPNIQYLLNKRVNIFIQDKFNKTAYDYAKEKPTIRFLLENYSSR